MHTLQCLQNGFRFVVFGALITVMLCGTIGKFHKQVISVRTKEDSMRWYAPPGAANFEMRFISTSQCGHTLAIHIWYIWLPLQTVLGIA